VVVKIPKARVGLAAVLCAGLWITHVVLKERNANAECRALLASGKLQVVEGLIHHVWYHEKTQGFSVNNANFSYSYSVNTGGINGSLFGDPIRDGKYARIYFIGNVIIKIQLRR
jgi:hypothetical protein